MMKDFTISNMLDLNETIAAELFEGKTYPWEVLPEIGEFIIKLGKTLDPSEYEKMKMYGSQNLLLLRRLQVLPDRLSLVGRRRYVTVPLSAARPLLAKAQLWETPQSLRMRCSLIKCRFRIIIMLEMQYLGINPIWEPDRFVLM